MLVAKRSGYEELADALKAELQRRFEEEKQRQADHWEKRETAYRPEGYREERQPQQQRQARRRREHPNTHNHGVLHLVRCLQERNMRQWALRDASSFMLDVLEAVEPRDPQHN